MNPNFGDKGDIFRWRDVWSQIADWFGLKAGAPLKASRGDAA
jgi:hypothetical protein